MNYSKLPLHNDNLRMHQIEGKRKIFDAWNTCNAVMLQMPTGTGKTYLFTSIVNDLLTTYKKQHQEIHILIVVHRTELVDQISATLSRYGIVHGLIQGSREQHLWKRVQVASIMSILTDRNYYSTIRMKFDYIIVDEAHHSLANTYIELFKLFPNAKKLGVTATPWRLNHESFLKLYQKLITSPQISWFINNHLLSDFDYVSIKPDSDVQRLVNSSKVAQNGDFSNTDLDNTFNNQRIRSKIYEAYKKFAYGRKGIIYAINKCHASKIAELYSQNGISAISIDCDTPIEERMDLIEQFKSGKIKVLVNVEIFTEGFDCPDVSFIQLARPTKSLALYLQQVGRGLRMIEGKERTIIIDNVGLYNYFGLPDANRKWQHHFIGREYAENVSCKGQEKDKLKDYNYEFDESRLHEYDEEMQIVRGASLYKNITQVTIKDTSSFSEIKEFTLCNYYLIRGNQKNFKVYPLIKNKGKQTGGVGSCIYKYDSLSHPIIFTTDSELNIRLIEKDTKLQIIIKFSSMLLNVDIHKLLNLSQLCVLSKKTFRREASIFDVLKMMSHIKL